MFTSSASPRPTGVSRSVAGRVTEPLGSTQQIAAYAAAKRLVLEINNYNSTVAVFDQPRALEDSSTHFS